LKINNNIDASINWFYEEWDDDMMEIGEDFSQDLKLSFNLMEIEETSADQINNAVAA
jgi:hypothetical protein